MGDGSHVLDEGDFQTGGLKRTDSGLTASAGALDVDLNGLHAMLDSDLGSSLGCRLSCKRSALAAAAEVQGAGGAPGHCITLQVGDSNDSIVEGRLDVSLTSSNVLALFPLHADICALLGVICTCHFSNPPYFFLLATVRFGPLQVRALFL